MVFRSKETIERKRNEARAERELAAKKRSDAEKCRREVKDIKGFPKNNLQPNCWAPVFSIFERFVS